MGPKQQNTVQERQIPKKARFNKGGGKGGGKGDSNINQPAPSSAYREPKNGNATYEACTGILPVCR